MMRNTTTLLERHFGGCDLYVLIDLDRVAIDYFTVHCQRQFDSQGAFAGCGWANDGNQRFGLFLCVCAHAREDSTRKMTSSQRSASSRSAPIIWLREKRMVASQEEIG